MKKIIFMISLLVLAGTSFAERKVTYEEFSLELRKHQEREEVAKARIAVLESEIADLNRRIEETKNAIRSKWAEMLAHVGITQEEYDAFVQRIDDFIRRVRGFESQYGSDLKAWAAAITDAEREFSEIKSHRIAVFPRLDPKIAEAGRALEDSKNALNLAQGSRNTAAGTYTVRLIPERRDCLWRIAEYPEIYGDPFQWPKIYSANRDQIKDPDLIFPGQVFQIPR